MYCAEGKVVVLREVSDRFVYVADLGDRHSGYKFAAVSVFDGILQVRDDLIVDAFAAVGIRCLPVAVYGREDRFEPVHVSRFEAIQKHGICLYNIIFYRRIVHDLPDKVVAYERLAAVEGKDGILILPQKIIERLQRRSEIAGQVLVDVNGAGFAPGIAFTITFRTAFGYRFTFGIRLRIAVVFVVNAGIYREYLSAAVFAAEIAFIG